MSQSERRSPQIPLNPGVRALVEGKRAWDSRPRPGDEREGFRGWRERGYIPHRDSPGLTQFITYHLTDAFPKELLAEWAALLKIEEERERRKQLEAYLDIGRGHCWLRRQEIADICDQAFRYFDGERYDLRAWCVMPNHIHVLVNIRSVPMGEVVQSWKGYTGRECNKRLRPKGGFWASEYWDTYMRDEDQERATVRYIENNPTKAKLVAIARDWPWSSARYRDEFGTLSLPIRERRASGSGRGAPARSNFRMKQGSGSSNRVSVRTLLRAGKPALRGNCACHAFPAPP